MPRDEFDYVLHGCHGKDWGCPYCGSKRNMKTRYEKLGVWKKVPWEYWCETCKKWSRCFKWCK